MYYKTIYRNNELIPLLQFNYNIIFAHIRSRMYQLCSPIPSAGWGSDRKEKEEVPLGRQIPIFF